MLTMLAWTSLIVAAAGFLVIAIDEVRHPQKMWIMNLVWPITALYFSVVAVWAYFTIGRRMARPSASGDQKASGTKRGRKQKTPAKPSWSSVAVSASHCGAGCTLGDIISEFTIFGLGLTLFGQKIYADFAGDLLLAWLLGIVFQYFMIKPMNDLRPGRALVAAIKADTLSILSFEIGLFAWMGFSYFVLFPRPHLMPNQPAYWLMMQIGMVLGFLTTYPMNYWLVKAGVKESMG